MVIIVSITFFVEIVAAIYGPATRRMSENRESIADNPFWSDFPIIFLK